VKKKIIISVIALSAIIIAAAFKTSNQETKEYLTIYHNDEWNKCSISFSDGTFKLIDYKKPKAPGDQTHILKLINEYETQGYNVLQYDFKTLQPDSRLSSSSVLMVK
jgi:hypothetical protein